MDTVAEYPFAVKYATNRTTRYKNKLSAVKYKHIFPNNAQNVVDKLNLVIAERSRSLSQSTHHLKELGYFHRIDQIMNLLLKPSLFLYFTLNIFLISATALSTWAFTYSTLSSPSVGSNNNNGNFYFRSATNISGASSYDSQKPPYPSSRNRSANRRSSRHQRRQASSSSEPIVEDDDEDETEPGKMRVSEIKAELDLREVAYKDCFDKESLIQRLQDARSTGKANPKILEKFNKQKLEETFDPSKKVKVDDNVIATAVGGDGKLPGGLTPEQFKKLAGNTDIMSMLQSTKMQEAMQLMMTGGHEELEQKLKDDPELQETVAKLDVIMKGTMS